MGVKLDEGLTSKRNGVYCFCAQDGIYHAIPDFLPDDRLSPRFLQLYIYNTEHADENRLKIMPSLRRDTIKKIRCILNEINPFVSNFCYLSEIRDLSDYRLIIRADSGLDQRVYNTLTASQVAAIWIEGVSPVAMQNRDVVIFPRSGKFQRVSEVGGYYDPMQYPFLFPRSEHGWHIGMREHDEKIMLREYYTYQLQIRNHSLSLVLLGGHLLQ